MPATGTILKVIEAWLILAVFLGNITSCACLDRSGLRIIFLLYVQSEIFFRSPSSWLAELLGSCKVADNDVPSKNNLAVDC